MLGVYKGGEAAHPLGLRDDVQGERSLTTRLWAENLDYTASRNTANAEC
jgi:hypothetical protein